MSQVAFGVDGSFTPPVAAGSTTASSGSSQSVSIPNAADGNRARCVAVTCNGNVYVKFTKGVGTATNADFMMPSNWPITFFCKQFDTISFLQETAAAKINIVPIEV